MLLQYYSFSSKTHAKLYFDCHTVEKKSLIIMAYRISQICSICSNKIVTMKMPKFWWSSRQKLSVNTYMYSYFFCHDIKKYFCKVNIFLIISVIRLKYMRFNEIKNDNPNSYLWVIQLRDHSNNTMRHFSSTFPHMWHFSFKNNCFKGLNCKLHWEESVFQNSNPNLALKDDFLHPKTLKPEFKKQKKGLCETLLT